MSGEAPKLFVSYSWDSEDHKTWVRQLATDLQNKGVHVYLDQWDTYPGRDIPNYMETSIRECEYVLLICTPKFQGKANIGKGGVGYEKNIVTGEIWSGSPDRKFIPVVKGDPENSLPSYLKSKIFIDFRDESKYQEKLEEILRHVYKSPKYSRPPLGSRPDFSKKEEIKVIPEPKNNVKSGFQISRFKELYDFAYSEDGLDYTKEGAQEWALKKLKKET